jgi:hypothetical protein
MVSPNGTDEGLAPAVTTCKAVAYAAGSLRREASFRKMAYETKIDWTISHRMIEFPLSILSEFLIGIMLIHS